MFRVLALMTLVLAATRVTALPVVSVDCDAGQSLNRTLANVNKVNSKDAPATVLVKGTCTEYVRISGFDGLTLKGLQGATLLQPSTDPGNGNSRRRLTTVRSATVSPGV